MGTCRGRAWGPAGMAWGPADMAWGPAEVWLVGIHVGVLVMVEVTRVL